MILFFRLSDKACGTSVSALRTDDHSTTDVEEGDYNINLFRLDPGLESYKDHFKYRVQRYDDQKNLIEKYEGGLEEFAQGKDGIRVKYFNLSVGNVLV